MNINVIATSNEGNTPLLSENELFILGGKYGGTCYAVDGYETIKTQPEEKAYNRAISTAKNGHHSVFGHSMVTMEISDCPKIIAMLLNSIGVSNTSEKSARYTKMVPLTSIESEKYQKWHDSFVILINKTYPEKFTDKEVDKLAYENARYMLSVFTKTSMVYSVPFRNLHYIYQWSEQMIKTLNTLPGSFNQQLAIELNALLLALSDFMHIPYTLTDNKNESFRFMPYQALGYKDSVKSSILGDVYSVTYKASFACIAQEQRHRTLRLRMNFKGETPEEYGFYVPEILEKDEILKNEWLRDLHVLAANNVWPQATLVEVVEQGLFEDHVLKCKERMCGRAQLETMLLNNRITMDFWSKREYLLETGLLSEANYKRLCEIVQNENNGMACARCKYPGFKCVEGCKWGPNNALTRLI